jgi:pimeloyl-ACP methyl ester carboxylesterase
MLSEAIAQRSLALPKSKIYYREAGDGLPLILVHGFGHSSTSWLRAMPMLADHYRTIAPDLPDFNRTTGPEAYSSPKYFATVLTRFIERLKLDRVHLAGSSLGGLVSLLVALDTPELVDKIVLANPAGFTRPPRPPLDDAVIAFLTFWLSLPRPRPIVRAAYETAFFDRSRADEGTIEELIERENLPEQTKKSRARVLHELFRFSRHLDHFHERLGGLDTPTLLIWGRNDPLLPAKDVDVARRVLPRLRIELFERCGHLPQIEQPERFSSLVLDFLEVE